MFDGCYSQSVIKKSDMFEYENNCTADSQCFQNKISYWDVESILQHKNTLLSGILMNPDKIIHNPTYNSTWIQLFNGIESNINSWNIRKIMLRLILNPEKRLRNHLKIEKKQLLKKKYTIGLQLRMGGTISDTPEEYVGIPFSRLNEVIDQVRNVIKKKQWEGKVQVYISSDSSKTIQYIRNQTKKEFPVVESLLYQHGHTSRYLAKKDYANIMRKVVSDMYYMSICDHLIVSWPSSLGRMMCYVSDEDQCEAVLGWKVETKHIAMY